MNSKQRLEKIINRSGLSIAKFAKMLQKDRRTVVSWLSSEKELSLNAKTAIAKTLRYPQEIWHCDEKKFNSLLESVHTTELRMIDESYKASVEYIYENEDEGSLIIHPSFPNPAYRDFIVPLIYKQNNDPLVDLYRKKRGEKMRDFSFSVSEWYSIKSLLEFAFSRIGNFYTKQQRIQILELVIETFRDNLAKSLYFFDSYSKKIYGLDLFYTSINIKEQRMFFKAPIETLIVETRNNELIKRLHRHYTNAKECPPHIDPRDGVFVLELLLFCLKNNYSLLQTCKYIDQNSKYGEFFLKSINITSEE
ncbi:hypothetical protein [Campylobacter troglodytis]|uniref:hypothetical protein n=1 Tax=Campylobacter troglodytis TaxID=654363 RepID=UPI00115C0645|nr:hypothetical protein [Campylobacter troglodytis]TQR60238.1 hypothetical protein DMC01_06635 [Campylobacter troglodytis]